MTSCSYCGARAIHADHVMPKYLRKRFPESEWATLTTPSCGNCNWAKYTFRWVPPSMEDRIPELVELTGQEWHVYRGGPASEMFKEREAHK